MYSSIRSSYSFACFFVPEVHGSNTSYLETVNVKWGENAYVHYLFNTVIILFLFCTGSKASFTKD